MFINKIYFLLIIFIAFFSNSILIFSLKEIVFQKYNPKDRTRSFVSQKGVLEDTLSDFEDLFFEVIIPEDIRYSFRIRLAKGFGSSFTKTFKNIPLIPVEPFDGCSPIKNQDRLKGKVGLVLRGDCSFLTKALNVEEAGAIAVIIADNDPANDILFDMVSDGSNRIVNIPSVFLVWKDGYMIKKSIENSRLKQAIINLPVNLTLKNENFILKRAPWTHY